MLTQAPHGALHAVRGQPCHGQQGRPGSHLRTGQHFLHLHRVRAQGAIVNTRVIGVLAAGLLGGPYVGIGAAVIGGLHRYLFDIGGFTAVSCAVSTFVEGLIGSAFSKRLRPARLTAPGYFSSRSG